jgi:hypothetical protein
VLILPGEVLNNGNSMNTAAQLWERYQTWNLANEGFVICQNAKIIGNSGHAEILEWLNTTGTTLLDEIIALQAEFPDVRLRSAGCEVAAGLKRLSHTNGERIDKKTSLWLAAALKRWFELEPE